MSSDVPVRAQGGDHPVVGSSGPAVGPAARPFRRSFIAEYRARVAAEYEAAPHGQKAAVLRREGLYQSQVHKWMLARDRMNRGAAAPQRAHRASAGKDDPGRLRAENQRLTRELATSQAVVEIMVKLQGLLEHISESTGSTTR
jgi:transposase-like protein